MREHFVVSSIRSREVARAQRSSVRLCEDALKALDFGNSLLGVHSVTISNMGVAIVKRSGICMSRLRERPAPNGSQRFPTSSAGTDSRGEPDEGHSVRLRELTMRSISQPSSSGLPQRNRTYLPKRR